MSDNPVVEPADKFYNTLGNSEPTEPTEKPAVEEVEDQAPPEEVKENLDEPEVTSEELEAKDEAKESQYIELDGKEIDLDDVRKWQNGHMMQADYTKKTQTLSEERKTFETERDSDRDNLLKSQSEVSEMRDLLTVLTAEDDVIDWAELKVDDPDRYIELKEKADKRKDALAKVKAERETPADDPALIESERGKLFKANPEWFDADGKPTETYTKDITLMNEYASKAGFEAQEFSQMTRAHYLNTVLKAAKYDQLTEKGRKIKETREKVPVVTKPKAKNSADAPVSRHEKFYRKGADG